MHINRILQCNILAACGARSFAVCVGPGCSKLKPSATWLKWLPRIDPPCLREHSGKITFDSVITLLKVQRLQLLWSKDIEAQRPVLEPYAVAKLRCDLASEELTIPMLCEWYGCQPAGFTCDNSWYPS